MQRSFHIHTPSVLVAPSAGVTPGCPIRNGNLRVWGSESTEIIEQHFDGRYGYLYCYEIRCAQTLKIRIRVSEADLHGFYVFKSPSPVCIQQRNQPFKLTMNARRACFLYAARGRYSAQIPPGKTIIFGFMVDAGLFKRQRRPFPHLIALLAALEAKEASARASEDFQIGLLAEQHIKSLCSRLNPHDLSHESLIMQELITLVKLSREKIYEESEKRFDSNKRHADNARRLITDRITSENLPCAVFEIAETLGLHPDSLHKAYRRTYPGSLGRFRDQLLIKYIKSLLADGCTIGETLFRCGFESPSTFSKFFRRHTGMTAQEYIRGTQ